MTCNDDKSDQINSLPNSSSLLLFEPMVADAFHNVHSAPASNGLVESCAYFEFSKPFKSTHVATVITTPLFVRKCGDANGDLYEFSRPEEANVVHKSAAATAKEKAFLTSTHDTYMESENVTSSSLQQRNHVVVVEQAPFSVFKSFKSQESNDKVSVCLI